MITAEQDRVRSGDETACHANEFTKLHYMPPTEGVDRPSNMEFLSCHRNNGVISRVVYHSMRKSEKISTEHACCSNVSSQKIALISLTSPLNDNIPQGKINNHHTTPYTLIYFINSFGFRCKSTERYLTAYIWSD
jgi:hypothetical protein